TGDPNASASTTADNNCSTTDPNAGTDASLGGTDCTLSGSNTGTDQSVVYIDPVPVDQSIEPVPLPAMDSGTVDGQDTTGVSSDQGNYLPSSNGPAAIQNTHPIHSDPAADNVLRQAAKERSRLLL